MSASQIGTVSERRSPPAWHAALPPFRVPAGRSLREAVLAEFCMALEELHATFDAKGFAGDLAGEVFVRCTVHGTFAASVQLIQE